MLDSAPRVDLGERGAEDEPIGSDNRSPTPPPLPPPVVMAVCGAPSGARRGAEGTSLCLMSSNTWDLRVSATCPVPSDVETRLSAESRDGTEALIEVL